MNTFTAKEALPKGYRLSQKIDLVKNRKQLILVNALALVLGVGMMVLGLLIDGEGLAELFDLNQHALQTALKLLAASAGIFLYLIGHEAVHGAFMWHYSHVRPNFGFSLAYAYAGSKVYFAKNAYLSIALAPAVLWFLALGLMNLLLPQDWFWVIWFIQLMNISGSAGDFYVFARILRMPEDVLVQDTGTAMTVYLPQN